MYESLIIEFKFCCCDTLKFGDLYVGHWEYNIQCILCIFHRGFSLHKALKLIVDEDLDVANITILPLNNACGDVTDENFGNENYDDINNFPASLMQNEVEIVNKINFDSDWDTEDDIYLSQIRENSSKNTKKFKKNKKISLCEDRLVYL